VQTFGDESSKAPNCVCSEIFIEQSSITIGAGAMLFQLWHQPQLPAIKMFHHLRFHRIPFIKFPTYGNHISQ